MAKTLLSCKQNREKRVEGKMAGKYGWGKDRYGFGSRTCTNFIYLNMRRAFNERVSIIVYLRVWVVPCVLAHCDGATYG